MGDLTQRERITRLAEALCMEPTDQTDIVYSYTLSQKWWLVGCRNGDQPLPRTANCHTVNEALDAAEAWLAPELGRLK